MNAISGKIVGSHQEADLLGSRHWSLDMPYRTVVPVGLNKGTNVTLYQVAGSPETPRSAEKALRLALELHGGACHYCGKKLAKGKGLEATIDHIEPKAIGGGSELNNLAVSCKPCNTGKGNTRIDSYNPQATREWLDALQIQVEDRIKRLGV